VIEFALNYSRPAADLVRDGTVEIDRFKCPDWQYIIDDAAKLRPVYVHFPLSANRRDGLHVDLDAIEAMARATNTPFINLHLSPQMKDFGGWSDDEIEGRLIDDVNVLVERFSKARVMVEMVPFGNPEENFFQPATEPPMIRRIIERTGCGLLLDLSHARITARLLGKDERDFLDAMPIEHLRELHVTGLGFIGPILKDHLPMTDADWTVFEWALVRIREKRWATPWCIACEYGGVGELFRRYSDRDVMLRDIPRMSQMVRGISS
jgi:uncharacterized protein (UPF0276 family)